MRILILTAATGGGHKRAAAALQEAIKTKLPKSKVMIVDALEACGKRFNKTVTGGYHYMATKTPALYGTAYKLSDKTSPLNSLMDGINTQFSRKLLPTIVKSRADIIVSCHPFVTTMLGFLKGKGYIIQPVISIITDFAGHRAYIDDNIDKYVVANDDMISEMVVKYNVPREKVHSLGIPIFSRFYEKSDKAEILKKAELTPKLPTVLVMAGSFGVSDILNIYENLCELKTEFQIIVITGKNQKLHSAFEKILNKEPGDSERQKCVIKKPTKLFYFVDNVQDYMHAADLIITKPGGLTVSESLASALPMVIFRAFPGQEKDNADYLIRHGMAISLEKGKAGAQTVECLLNDKDALEKMKQNCRSYYKNSAAENVCNLIEETLEAHLSELEKEDDTLFEN